MATDLQPSAGENTPPQWAHELMQRIQAQDTTIEALRTELAVERARTNPSESSAVQPTLPSADLGRPSKNLPDPPEFQGRKNEFPAWLALIDAKLTIDKKDAPESVRFWYLHSRLRGKALLQVTPWIGTVRNTDMMTVDGLIAQLKVAYEDPKLMERAVFRLNSIRQNGDRFADFLAKFERTMMEAGGSVWTDSVKKNFLNNALSIELQKAMVATAQPDLYADYVSLLHTVSTNLEMLRGRERNSYGPRTKATEPEAFSTSTPMDWEPTQAVKVASAKAGPARWVSQEELVRRRESGACLRCGNTDHRIKMCPYAPAVRPGAQANSTAVALIPSPASNGEESEKEELS
jgi:hypothetical protein